MKLGALLLAAAPALASAFIAPALQQQPLRARSLGALRMVVEDVLQFDAKLGALEVEKGGVSAPFGFFDPLGFYKGKSTRQKKKLRESEIKHSRVAMLAFLGMLVQENFHPMLAGGPAGVVDQFHQLEEVDHDLGFLILFIGSLAEVRNINRGWDKIEETLSKPKIAGIRDDYVCGNNDYDPLKLCPDDEADSFIDMRTRELNNGRLAMIGVAGAIAQEVITGQPLFAFFDN